MAHGVDFGRADALLADARHWLAASSRALDSTTTTAMTTSSFVPARLAEPPRAATAGRCTTMLSLVRWAERSSLEMRLAAISDETLVRPLDGAQTAAPPSSATSDAAIRGPAHPLSAPDGSVRGGSEWQMRMKAEVARSRRRRRLVQRRDPRLGPSAFALGASPTERANAPVEGEEVSSSFVRAFPGAWTPRSCRHVPVEGTAARARLVETLVSDPHGERSGLRGARGEVVLPRALRAPPRITEVELAVARRRFLRYTDFLQNRDRGEERIPVWLL